MFEWVEMDATRKSIRISRRDRVRNFEVEERRGIEGNIMDDTEQKQLIWNGHVQTMNDRRHKKTWREGVSRAMSARDSSEGQRNNRRGWRAGIEQRPKNVLTQLYTYSYAICFEAITLTH